MAERFIEEQDKVLKVFDAALLFLHLLEVENKRAY